MIKKINNGFYQLSVTASKESLFTKLNGKCRKFNLTCNYKK